MELTSGTEVDRYTVIRQVGSGGLADVYLVRHGQLGSLHALKVLRVPSPGLRARLLQEGRVQGVLSHPNLVAVTDVVEVRGAPALVLHYVKGPSLAAFLAHHRPTTVQIDVLARGLLRGVAAAHRGGLVHRDLKPANVLLEHTDGEIVPKVTDFGLAKVLSEGAQKDSTRSGVAMGTPSYMSPEQVRDSATVDARSDVFALGALLYELCTGRRAFEGADTFEVFSAVTSGSMTPLQELAPDLPSVWVRAIERALAPDPAARFRDAGELAEAWSDGGPSLPPGTVSWDPAVLEVVESLGAGSSASLSPSAQTSGPSTFALTDAPHTRGEAAEAPTPREKDGARDLAMPIALPLALTAGLGSLPFLYGASSLPAPHVPQLLGWIYPLLLGMAAAGTGLATWLGVSSRSGRREVPLWMWAIAPYPLGLVTQVLTLAVAIPLDERGGPVAERASQLSHGLEVATAIDFVGQVGLSVVLGAVCACAALGLTYRTGLPSSVEPRQVRILGTALVGGGLVWFGSMVGSGGAPLPFLVFVILCLGGVDTALSARVLAPEVATTAARREQLVAIVATVLSVWAAAKSAMLNEQLFHFANVLANAPADRFLAAAEVAGEYGPTRAAPQFFAWILLSLFIGLLALRGGLWAALPSLRRELRILAVLAVVIFALDVAAFGSRMRAGGVLVTAFLEEAVHMQVGTSVTEDDDGGVFVDADMGLLHAGDQVLFVQGVQVDEAGDVVTALRDCVCEAPTAARCNPCLAPGKPAQFTLLRDRQRKDVEVPLSGHH